MSYSMPVSFSEFMRERLLCREQDVKSGARQLPTETFAVLLEGDEYVRAVGYSAYFRDADHVVEARIVVESAHVDAMGGLSWRSLYDGFTEQDFHFQAYIRAITRRQFGGSERDVVRFLRTLAYCPPFVYDPQ